MIESNTKVGELQAAIKNIDALAQESLTEIAAVARLALSSIQSIGERSSLRDIASALRAISNRAEMLENDINVEAEQVGCNYSDRAGT